MPPSPPHTLSIRSWYSQATNPLFTCSINAMNKSKILAFECEKLKSHPALYNRFWRIGPLFKHLEDNFLIQGRGTDTKQRRTKYTLGRDSMEWYSTLPALQNCLKEQVEWGDWISPSFKYIGRSLSRSNLCLKFPWEILDVQTYQNPLLFHGKKTKELIQTAVK